MRGLFQLLAYFSTLYQLDSQQQQHRTTSESFQQAGGIMVMSQRPGAWWVWRWVCRGWLVRIWGRLWKYEGLDFRFPPKLPRLRESYLKQISFLWRSVCLSACLSVICLSVICLCLLSCSFRLSLSSASPEQNQNLSAWQKHDSPITLQEVHVVRPVGGKCKTYFVSDVFYSKWRHTDH